MQAHGQGEVIQLREGFILLQGGQAEGEFCPRHLHVEILAHAVDGGFHFGGDTAAEFGAVVHVEGGLYCRRGQGIADCDEAIDVAVVLDLDEHAFHQCIGIDKHGSEGGVPCRHVGIIGEPCRHPAGVIDVAGEAVAGVARDLPGGIETEVVAGQREGLQPAGSRQGGGEVHVIQPCRLGLGGQRGAHQVGEGFVVIPFTAGQHGEVGVFEVVGPAQGDVVGEHDQPQRKRVARPSLASSVWPRTMKSRPWV